MLGDNVNHGLVCYLGDIGGGYTMKISKLRTVKLYKGTPKECLGVEYTSKGKSIGVFTGSVGPHGTSTGIFTHAKTSAPFSELGIEEVTP